MDVFSESGYKEIAASPSLHTPHTSPLEDTGCQLCVDL